MAFRVGMKVVFIGGPQREGAVNIVISPNNPTVGTVYTIRGLDHTYLPYYGMVGVAVEEVRNEPIPWNGTLIEPLHLADRFRPVIERKTDTGMAILRKLLDGNKIEEKV